MAHNGRKTKAPKPKPSKAEVTRKLIQKTRHEIEAAAKDRAEKRRKAKKKVGTGES